MFISQDLADYVSRCGILPINDLIDSDHRAIYMDIDLGRFLKGQVSASLTASTRGIQSGNPKAVEKYQKLLETFLRDNQIMEKMRTLHVTSEQRPLSQSETEDFAELEQRILDAERAVERISAHPWSPKLRTATNLVKFWYAWLLETRHGMNKEDYRRRLLPYIPLPINPTDSQIRQELRIAKKELNAIHRQAADLRLEHLTALAEMYANTGHQTAENALKGIIRTESMKKTFARARQILGRTFSSGLAHLLLNPPGAPDVAIFDQDEMEQALNTHNIKHFSQADGTPFASDPIKTTFGLTGTNENSRRLLNGDTSVIPSGISSETDQILRHMQRVCETEIDMTFNEPELKQSYSIWGEDTTTSPSGTHLGHYKACLRHIKPKETTPVDTDNEMPPHISDDIFTLKAQVLNIAFRNTIIIPRWKTIINIMLEKIPGKPHINKLRIIHIIKNDFNMATGILWGRRLMTQGESLMQFGEEQSGSRKNKQCPDVLLLKHLTYSITRLSKRNGTTFDNDAKSCYDRIVMLLASLASQRIGMPAKACEMFLTLLSQVQYKTRTSHGISETTYGKTPEYTIHGPGQGGRSSPAIWTVISLLILNCMKSSSNGLYLEDPYARHTIAQTSSGFVDDITHWNIDMRLPSRQLSPYDLIQEAQHTAQSWERLLHSTGGKLALEKCLYYAMYWDFDEEGVATLRKASEYTQSVQLTDSETQEQITIEQKECTESHKTLGSFENPAGIYTEETKRLRKKADHFALMISSNSQSREEAWTIYRSVYIPSMTYSLASGTLTLPDAKTVQSSITEAFLPSIGFPRKFPHAVAFTSKETGGLGLQHLFAEQGCAKVKKILDSMRRNQPISQMILTTLQWAQRTAGTSTALLQHPDKIIHQIEGEDWITTLRQFLSLSNLSIEIPAIITVTPKREHDIAIMSHSSIQQMTPTTILMINRCMIYLHAETLADICTSSGSHIRQHSIDCLPSSRCNDTTMWPEQSEPGPKHRKAWKKFLRQLCQNTSWQLLRPLGQWTADHKSIPWEAWYDKSTESIFTEGSKGKWQYHNIVHHRRFWRATAQVPWLGTAHPHYIPVDIISQCAHLISIPVDTWTPEHPEAMTPIANTPCSILPRWQSKMMRDVSESSIALLRTALDDGKTIYLASDGSAKDDRGSYAWNIATHSTVLATYSGIVNGFPMTPFRTEAMGMLSGLQFLVNVSQQYDTQKESRITLLTDCKALIPYIAFETLRHPHNNSLRSDFDATTELHRLYRMAKQTYPNIQPGEYVPTYKSTKESAPTWREQLIINCDSLARSRRAQIQTTSDEVTFCNGPIIRWNKRILTGRILQTVRWSWRNKIGEEYLQEKLKVTKRQSEYINWNAFALSRHAIPPRLIPFTIKLTTRWLAVGTRLAKYGSALEACHLCGVPETLQHLFQCQQKRQMHESFATQLAEFLHSIGTQQHIQVAIVTGIHGWLLQQPAEEDRATIHQSVRAAYDAQTSIGWEVTFSGVFHTKWSNTQDPDTHKGNQWQKRINVWMILQAHNIWTERCNARHKNDAEDPNHQSRETKAQLERLYSLAQDKLSTHDFQHLFVRPLEAQAQLSEASNRQWIPQMFNAVRNQIARAISRQGQPDIRTFFQPKQN